MSGYRFDRLKILIVDDNPHLRKLVAAILHAFGVNQIAQAANASRAWAMLRDVNPDVIILDWVMDGMSGVELAKMIRTDPGSPNPFVPIIMLTGNSLLEHVHLARDAGVNEFLAKPVSSNAILTRLLAVIEHPRPFVRTKVYFGPCRRRRRIRDEYEGPERRQPTDAGLDKKAQQETSATT
ncbi:MAG: response regulator [Alphaproteobacteria bacterium]|nr:response regulator [Alphaproteobacteria bacterium]MBU6472446.1 response regulator [Alphaproteobacteria bacterium]MDE2012514.1 response regulator [Alphaproteobacteria bacterium]MDE2072812.1 response regulator [Alphaproteobacteria bacterium]MDE2351162.1 response regulator [Alphaproteobacteria bacterium]